MKFIRKKIIRGHSYYYFEFPWRSRGERSIFTRFLGKELPSDLAEVIPQCFNEISRLSEEKIDSSAKKYFAPKAILPIEQARFWYRGLHHELFANDLHLFQSLFAVLFLLNSNRSEGSRMTRRDIEKIIQRKRKPKTIMDQEVVNSLAALRLAFSREMRWNIASMRRLHAFLFDQISPHTAGKLKTENNVINNESTTDWKSVRKELKQLLFWFLREKKKGYPPLVALEFHHRFEAIHPFDDGNGRIGRLLFNAYLLQEGYMPVIFFSENHSTYMDAISQARHGRKRKLAHYFIKQLVKTRKAIELYKQEGVLRGGSPQVGQWEIERGKIRKY
ncbi:MAG: Fic family protein [Patescibacteria group bacterium]